MGLLRFVFGRLDEHYEREPEWTAQLGKRNLGTGGTGFTASCSGTITATFTWTGPSGTAPGYAVVTQTCSAGAWTYSGSVTVSNSFGDAVQTHTSSPPPDTSKNCGYDASGNLIPHYLIKTAGSSFTVTCAPSATGTGVPCSVGVGYTAHADPIQVTVSGACVDPSDSSLNCLVGQHIVYGVSAGPLVPVAFDWSNIGSEAHWFSYTVYGAIGSAGNNGDYYAKRETWGPSQGWDTQATVPVYYDKSGAGAFYTDTPTCAVSLSDPKTGAVIGSATATANVRVWGPYFWFTQLHGAPVIYHTDNLGNVDGVEVDQSEGVEWESAVGTEALFAITNSEDYGQWAYAQIINSLLRRREGYNFIWVTAAQATLCLDTSWPYDPTNHPLPTGWSYGNGWVADSTEETRRYADTGDAPSLVSTSSDLGFDVHDNFSMHLMYQPPAVLPGDPDPSEWIPLSYDNWGWDANPTRSTPVSPWPALFGSTWDNGKTDWPEWTLQWENVFVSNG